MMETTALDILRSIYESQPVTRRVLCEQVGLSAGRVSSLVARLIARGIVCEQVYQNGTPGRPAAALSVSPDAGRVVGVDIGGRHSRAVLVDLGGRVRASITRCTRVVSDRAAIMDDIAGLVQAICAEGGKRAEGLLALGVGIQGIVDTRTGVVLGWPNTPAWAAAWTDLDLPRELAARLGGGLLVVDDSVRAMGVTASRFGPARKSEYFLYAFLGAGIGSGLFVDGRPYRGSSGLAGEIGHVTVEEGGLLCSCGNRGCLEMLASTAAVLRRVEERLAEARVVSTLRDAQERGDLTLDALIEAARGGDKLAFQILDETGTYVGRVIAIALNLLGPDLVVLGGPLAQDGGIILEAVQRQVRLRALEHISRQTRIVYDDQGELAGARGAALLALDAFFRSEKHLSVLLAGES